MIRPEAPREKFADRQRVDGRPRFRAQAKELMFEREIATRYGHGGVDPGGMFIERRSYFGRSPFPFELGGVAQAERQKPLIDRDGRLAEQLR